MVLNSTVSNEYDSTVQILVYSTVWESDRIEYGFRGIESAQRVGPQIIHELGKCDV